MNDEMIELLAMATRIASAMITTPRLTAPRRPARPAVAW
jgi:hypothetical protein